MYPKTKLVFLTTLSLVLLTACSTLFSPERAFRYLKEAETPEQEADALIYINNHAEDIGLAAFDKAGSTLEPYDSRFPKEVFAIDLHVNGQSTYHRMIEPENLYILLRE